MKMENLSFMKTAVIILLLHCTSGQEECVPDECGEDNCIINQCYEENTSGLTICGPGGVIGCQLNYYMGPGPTCGDGQCPKNTYCATDNNTCLPETPINVAFNKPTNSKSSSVYATPRFGNDYTTLRFISSSNPSADQMEWWCVNLEVTYDFQEIVLYNHMVWNGLMHVPDDKIKGFEIRVSDIGACLEGVFSQSAVCYKDTSAIVKSGYRINDCNQGDVDFSGRSIYIGLENSQLDFVELAVYANENICETDHHCLGYGICVNGKCQVPKCNEKYCFSDLIRVP